MNLIKRENANWVDPFALMTDLHDEMNRWFTGSLRKYRDRDFLGIFAPEIELTEDQESYQLRADLPGLTKDNIGVEFSGSVLTLKGERKEENEKKDKHYYHSERRYGSFQRVIEFPTDIQADKVKASYKDGVLELVIPKAENAKPKQIKVELK